MPLYLFVLQGILYIPYSWNLAVYPISLPRGPEEILRYTLRKLVLLRPIPDLLEIATLVFGIEVHKG